MPTPYSKNMYLSNLFVYDTLDSQLSSCMSIKRGIFFFPTFCCIITPISGIIDRYYVMQNLKKSGENKNTLRTIYPKILTTASLGSNFTGSYKKRECATVGRQESPLLL